MFSFRPTLWLGLALWPLAVNAGPFDKVAVEPSKTSIYVGSVSLSMDTFNREVTEYAADYRVKVFPYFFYNEQGRLWITFSDEQLQQLARGERVIFSGHAKNKDGEERRIEGHADPTGPNAKDGKIKVRVFVTKKIQLIFNTTYRFEGE